MKPACVTTLSLGLVAVLSMVVDAHAPRYTVTRTGDVVELEDTVTQMKVSVFTPVNSAFEVQLKGQDLIRKTFLTPEQFKTSSPGLNGVPLLWPYANRLDEQAFYANGTKYTFDAGLGNTGRGAIPIHGYLQNARDWKVVEVKADAKGAWITSRLDFYRDPKYMKQFPFAHTLTITYRVSEGALEVRTKIDNMSNEPMPISLGFHPYFQLTDSNRADWTISVGAKTHWKLAPTKIPTGETEPIESVIPNPKTNALKDLDLDDVFSDMVRDPQGRATVSFKGKQQQIDVTVDQHFKSFVLYSPNPANATQRGGGGGNRGQGGQAPAGAPPAGAAGAPAAATPAAGVAAAQPAGTTLQGGGNRGGAPTPEMAALNAANNARGFFAIEPMVGITDSMNLAQKGLYQELQSVPAGGSWTASFWIRGSGY
jgi:aldose 1-epimerase